MHHALCKCDRPPFSYKDFESTGLGEDPGDSFAEVELGTCKHCGARWLKYLIEWPHHSQSSRWWRVRLDDEYALAMTAADAKAYIEAQDWCFVGGSFHGKGTHQVRHPIHVA